jgi:hypothetical protein
LAKLEANPSFTRLDPKLLPVSCERIKQLLWRQLEATALWRGRISVGLYPASSADDPISLNADQFRDGWQYRVALPNFLERSRYVRTLVQVLLLEFANRTAKDHSSEIPFWLTEGFTQEVLASSDMDVILPPAPQTAINGLWVTVTFTNHQRIDPLTQAHAELQAGSPLSFQQLSWPEPEPTAEGESLYRSSAQLFVHSLLAMKDGPASLRAMLEELPEHYNWQFAFLHAFRAAFSRPLDVEKWWALQTAHFTGRELAQTWELNESWQKLDETIRSFVQVRLDTNDLPLEAEVSLQTVLREWDTARQTQALQLKVRELEQLRLRLAPEHVALADEYRQTLAAYLEHRDHANSLLPFRKHALQRRALDDAVHRLDALDGRRALARPAPQAPAQAKVEPGASSTGTHEGASPK